LILVLGIVSAVGGWQYRTTVTQMDRLKRAFDAAGRGEYDHDISLSGGDEWSDIAAGFDDLLCELSQRERILERRRQRLAVLNRVLRHNLRNDLGVVLGYSDMIRKGEASDPQNLAEIIHKRASTLVELGKSARETQHLMADVTDPEPVDVGKTLLDVVDDLSTEYPDVRFETDVPIPAYAFVVSGIDTALRNVCENACEYNDAEIPCVDISLGFLGGDRLRITVTDNGPGIPSYEVGVLQRGHETSLDHGSGLGLWLVQWVVDGSDGHLTVEQTEPRGTVVTIELDTAPSPYDRFDR
jgi:signal transduction histidine kinase